MVCESLFEPVNSGIKCAAHVLNCTLRIIGLVAGHCGGAFCVVDQSGKTFHLTRDAPKAAMKALDCLNGSLRSLIEPSFKLNAFAVEVDG